MKTNEILGAKGMKNQNQSNLGDPSKQRFISSLANENSK